MLTYIRRSKGCVIFFKSFKANKFHIQYFRGFRLVFSIFLYLLERGKKNKQPTWIYTVQNVHCNSIKVLFMICICLLFIRKMLSLKKRQLVVLPVCDVDHRSGKLFWFQRFLQFHQLALEKGSHSKGIQFNRSFTEPIRSKIKAYLLLLEGGVQPSLHIHPIMSV